MTKQEIYDYFNEMIEVKDNAMAWDFDTLDFSELTGKEEMELYIKLFDQTWHSNHENIALFFQKQKNPLATDILFKTATRNDIDQFDYKPLSRKCVWALADIGTEKAKNYLEQLAKCGNEFIEGFAKKRLDNWEDELYRKGSI